jgi:hypothetical protein
MFHLFKTKYFVRFILRKIEYLKVVRHITIERKLQRNIWLKRQRNGERETQTIQRERET